jgi:poly-gamma-glutamate capsule biosynthesis protein CapA/YwtB (metallophosphatase superfamily)
MRDEPQMQTAQPRQQSLRLFLCGDVMCGRGIDQVLAHPCSSELYEDYIRSAEEYVLLAEQVNGRIPRCNGPSYVWGVALDEFKRMRPDVRIINLETAVTRSNDRAHRGINYRMSPENAACLAAARIDCCVLANNHVLDWGRAGLLETLTTLQRLNVKIAGAGRNDHEACTPAVLNFSTTRLLFFSFGTVSSGIPRGWAATADTAGVNLLSGLSNRTLQGLPAKSSHSSARAILSSSQFIGDAIGDIIFQMSRGLLLERSSTKQGFPWFTGILHITREPLKSITIVSFSMAAAIF